MNGDQDNVLSHWRAVAEWMFGASTSENTGTITGGLNGSSTTYPYTNPPLQPIPGPGTFGGYNVPMSPTPTEYQMMARIADLENELKLLKALVLRLTEEQRMIDELAK